MSEDEVPRDARLQVAAAVRTALAKHGYERLTTAKIAEESDKSEAGLYYYYDSKDGMIAAFLETAAEHRAETFGDVDADDPEAQLRAACEQLFVEYDDDQARGLNVAVMELLSHAPYNETIREPLLAFERTTYDHLVAIVEAGVESGTFRAVDPEGTAAFLMAAAHGATGFYLALGMHDAGEALHDQVGPYVDSLLAEG